MLLTFSNSPAKHRKDEKNNNTDFGDVRRNGENHKYQHISIANEYLIKILNIFYYLAKLLTNRALFISRPPAS